MAPLLRYQWHGQTEIAILELEGKRAKDKAPKKDSSNSSVPPSKDENRPKRNKSLRDKSGKKPGGQPGHKGHALAQSQNPDKVENHVPQYCGCCGESLAHAPAELALSRQEVDIPPVKAVVTEHRAYQKACGCGHVTRGRMPERLKAPIQYGPGVRALVGYFHARQYLPYQRMAEMFSDCFGLGISQGSIGNMIGQLAEKATPVYDRIRREVGNQPVVGADETGVKVNGDKNWAWVWQSTKYTYIHMHPKRGYVAIQAAFPEGLANSVLCHDAWAAYFGCDATTHQLCVAHLLRELKYLQQERPKNQWVKDCRRLFLDALQLKRELTPGQYRQPNAKRSKIEERLDRLLDKTTEKLYGDAKKLRDRLRRYREYLLVFLYHEHVPPDNNASERAIRNLKVKMKVSGQFKSFAGAQNFAILRSVVDTLNKQGHGILEHLRNIAELTPEPMPSH